MIIAQNEELSPGLLQSVHTWFGLQLSKPGQNLFPFLLAQGRILQTPVQTQYNHFRSEILT